MDGTFFQSFWRGSKNFALVYFGTGRDNFGEHKLDWHKTSENVKTTCILTQNIQQCMKTSDQGNSISMKIRTRYVIAVITYKCPKRNPNKAAKWNLHNKWKILTTKTQRSFVFLSFGKFLTKKDFEYCSIGFGCREKITSHSHKWSWSDGKTSDLSSHLMLQTTVAPPTLL